MKQFSDNLAFDPEAIGPGDLDRYAASFEAAGAMWAGLEL